MQLRPSAVALATTLALGLTALPLSGTALARSAPSSSCTARVSPPATAGGPDTEALCAALAGLPDQDATAALIRVGGKGSWHGVAGVRDIRTGAPALENARFRAGSVTKVVTAAIVLQLAAEGRISLDGTVQHYLPGMLTERFKPVTVRQLLNYTSGLQSGPSLGDTVEDGYPHRFETLTPRQVVQGAVAKGPGSDPGTQQDYDNIHYTVLGLLIEKVTGDSYAHQAAVRVFRPLGMRDSSFPDGPDPLIHGPHNRGYDWLDGALVDVTDWNMSDRFAAGDMISTTADLERLLVALFRGRVVPEPQLEEMFTLPAGVPDATYAAGLERIELNGRVVWGKTGSRPGCAAVIAATRDLSRTLVYAVNATDAKGDGLPIAQRFGFPAFNR